MDKGLIAQIPWGTITTVSQLVVVFVLGMLAGTGIILKMDPASKKCGSKCKKDERCPTCDIPMEGNECSTCYVCTRARILGYKAQGIYDKIKYYATLDGLCGHCAWKQDVSKGGWYLFGLCQKHKT